MTGNRLEFPGHSFWDIASPQQSATALRQMFGDGAAAAAQSCAKAAQADERDDDHRYWIAVLARLKSRDRPDPPQEEIPPCRPASTRQRSP